VVMLEKAPWGRTVSPEVDNRSRQRSPVGCEPSL
jgi:hypothetical protein